MRPRRESGPAAAFAATAAALLLAALPGAAWAQPVVYTLDPDASFVHAEVRHFDASTIRVRFGPVAGTVQLDRAARRGEVGLSIDTGSVSTGYGVFDSRLREADLLASTAHPQAYFVSRRFVLRGDELVELVGEFTLRGTSQPLALKATRFACRTEDKVEVCGGEFEASVLRSDFGATFGLPFIADRVRIVVQVQGRGAAR